MYTIRAFKVDTPEYVNIASFRSNKKAKEALCKIFSELSENLPDGDTIKSYMGIHQFTHQPKKGYAVVYFIAAD